MVIIETTVPVKGENGQNVYWYTSIDPIRSCLVRGDSQEHAQAQLLDYARNHGGQPELNHERDLLGHFELIGLVMEVTAVVEADGNVGV